MAPSFEEMKDMTSGYYRSPTIHQDTVVFVCEDDLWSVPVDGGVARRLTSNLGAAGLPRFSPDGELLAFTGQEDGPKEVYCMLSAGGEAKRLTYQGGADVTAWDSDGRGILYSSGAESHFSRAGWLWRVTPTGEIPERLPYGPANHISFGPDGRSVLGRHTMDPARWKRYRGGRVGQMWIDPEGGGEFKRLEPSNGNFTSPMWIDDRIYFISDHEGIGNLYSCEPGGEDLARHTHESEYYCRNASTDGKRIVYHCGGDLHVYAIADGQAESIDVEFRSPRIQRQRRFVDQEKYLQEVSLHPEGHSSLMTVRGSLFAMGNWEGAVVSKSETGGVRYRLSKWMSDGERILTVSDREGVEEVEILSRDGESERLDQLDIGHAHALDLSPTKDEIVLANHRRELIQVDLESRTQRVLDHSDYMTIHGVSFSSDGRWVAYAISTTERTCSVKVVCVESGETWMVTAPEFTDVSPSWDPGGKYLYFISYREFNPVYDDLHFDLGFPQAMRPMLVTLRKDLGNPFTPEPEPLKESDSKDSEEDKSEESEEEEEGSKKETRKDPVEIDFAGIDRRVVSFPYAEGTYTQIQGIKGKVLLTSFPIEGTQKVPLDDNDEGPRGSILMYDFGDQKKETIARGVSWFILAPDRKTMAYRTKSRLRIIKAGSKPDDKAGGKPGRKSGWVDLKRLKVPVVPAEEWRQMYGETWRLQRAYFWTEDMSDVDWDRVYKRYEPMLDRIATRAEFSDLMWEMQGELGTSHCYEMGGDYRPGPNYAQGYLGADFEYDGESGGYRVSHIVSGDAWEERRDSSLNRPGTGVSEGDIVLRVGGQDLAPNLPPGAALVNLASQEVELTVADAATKENRRITVKALSNEEPARYREWVAKNRTYVREKTDGRVGYVHIPDMMGRGFAEFHRGYLAELDRIGMVVDVRYNTGGHVSPLLLEKLARKRIGYSVSRWRGARSYPKDTVLGPLVAIANENSGSDGDIFSHGFKLMGLGPLVGKRTWGGVVGISPHRTFVDGGTPTQPEHSYWFEDVGWGVENYGTDPDIEVDFAPQDYAADRDPQLDRAIEEIVRIMEEDPPEVPKFDGRPRLTLPRLPDAE